MNKNVICAFFAASLLTAGAAQAATSVEIPLQGVLPKECSVTAFVDGPFDALDMKSTAIQGAESLSPVCNYGGTLSVTFSSANSGSLQPVGNDGQRLQQIPYGFTVSGTSLDNVSLRSPQTVSNWPAVANQAQTRSMSVTLGRAATIAGTYTDTITATVAPN